MHGYNGDVSVTFQIPKASGRTTEVKSMSSEVSLPGFKFWLYHLVTVTLFFSFGKWGTKITLPV